MILSSVPPWPCRDRHRTHPGRLEGRTDGQPSRPVPELLSPQHAVPSPDGSEDGRPVHRKTEGRTDGTDDYDCIYWWLRPSEDDDADGELSNNEVNFIQLQSSHLSGQEPWDQEHFERLLGKFIVAMDQLFTLVQEPEFGELLQYMHKHTGRVPEILKEKSVKGKIMKIGNELENELTAMFAKNESKFSLSWTSSNGYAFIAMVPHWVNNSGDLVAKIGASHLLRGSCDSKRDIDKALATNIKDQK
ncbi:hypothetical protein B0H14DRAFT_3131744 [Mycena olivaceomarginata]|nr:hypothetical protein B0H14DRAFT_3131744 [Mycena olivaceomarginata]